MEKSFFEDEFDKLVNVEENPDELLMMRQLNMLILGGVTTFSFYVVYIDDCIWI